MKTKEKIANQSLTLFNTNTFELSTTSLIANQCDILEGSLWYHFKSKQDLVEVHSELFLTTFHQYTAPTHNVTELIERFFKVYNLLWDYRYLIRDSFDSIATTNETLYSKIKEMNAAIDNWCQITIMNAKQVNILLIDEADIESIVEITLIIGRYWLDFSRKKYPLESDNVLRQKGINLLIKSLSPYLSAESKTMIVNLNSG